MADETLMENFPYEIGGFLFGFPIVTVSNPFVTVRLPGNLTITANMNDGPIPLGTLLAAGAAYIPPSPPADKQEV